MAQGEVRDDAEVPPPNTASLLRFLDFVYAVVFTGFVKSLYDEIIYGPIEGGWPRKTILLSFSGFIFFFVATDWIHGRVLTEKDNYRNYTRFWVDLIIAFLAYGALRGVTKGATASVTYVTLMFFFGAIWAGIALLQGGECKAKFRLILGSHTAATIGLTTFYFWYVRGQSETLTLDVMWKFVLVIALIFLSEEALHVWFLPRSQWLGPSALPFPRGFIYRCVGKAREMWHRMMDDAPAPPL